MRRKEVIDSAVEHFRTRAGVKTVYGEPIVMKDKTVIPVARITLGAAAAGAKQHERYEDGGHDTASTEMANGTGAVGARPVGLVEISDHETRFVAFGQTKRLAIAAAVGSGLGVVLGWMLGRRKNGRA